MAVINARPKLAAVILFGSALVTASHRVGAQEQPAAKAADPATAPASTPVVQEADGGGGLFAPSPKLEPRIWVNVEWDPRVADLGPAVMPFIEPRSLKAEGVRMPLECVSFRPAQGSAQITVAVVNGMQDEPAARASLQAYVKALTQAVREKFEMALGERRKARDVAAIRVEETGEEVRKVDQELLALRQKMRQVSGRLDVSPEGLGKAAAGLEEEAQKLSIETSASEARKRALEEAVAKLTARAQEEAKGDAISGELQAILNARTREAALTEQLFKEGGVSAAEMEGTRAKVAEAKIRLLERREALAGGAGTDTVKQLNRELLMLSINLAEQQARKEVIRAMLERFEGAAQMLERAEEVRQRRGELEQQLAERRDQFRRLERELSDVRPPSVQVSGLEEKPKR